jgi:hypothetical protein
MAKRKPRSDRKHAVYCIRNILTDDFYIGITVTNGSAIKRAVKVRFQKHVSRAMVETKDWSFCKAIREWGAECFDHTVLEVVRGRKPAHQRERELIRTLKPTLNTF